MSYSTRYILMLVGAGLLLRLVFACLTPAWQSPDEFAHYWYADHIAESGTLPASEPVFPRYEAYQPPLYYLVISAALMLKPVVQPFTIASQTASGSLVLLRLISVLFSAATLMVVAGWLRRLEWLTDRERCVALAFVAFLPTYVGVSSTLNNDVLVALLGAVAIACGFGRRPDDMRSWALAGFWAGLALLAKLSAILLLPALVIALLVRPQSRAGAMRAFLAFAVPWFLGAGLFVAYNLWQDGHVLAVNPGLARGWDLSVSHIVQAVRNFGGSFVIAFGRTYNIKPGAAVYLLLGAPLLLAAVVGWWRARRQSRPAMITMLLPLALGIIFSLAYTLAYPTGIMTSWGKNIYPLLPLSAVAAAVGWSRCSPRFGKVLSLLAIVILLAGCMWGLVRLAGS